MKANKAQVEARVTELLRRRLAGTEFWDIREYVREREQEEGSPWKLADGQKPLSDSQLWRYLARVDQRIADDCRASRKKQLRLHLAQRRCLYARALAQGDIRAALACKRDEAELLGLYPKDTDALLREMAALRKGLAGLKGRNENDECGAPTPGGGPHPGNPGGPGPAP
jgi:hypothetical protein